MIATFNDRGRMVPPPTKWPQNSKSGDAKIHFKGLI
jgi:hypothetical protein